MKKLNSLLLLAALVGLAACNTVAGVGADITNAANSAGGYIASH